MPELTIWDNSGTPHKFAIVMDSELGGKRAVVRNYRESNVSDPGRLRIVQWELATAIGYSQESTSGLLACDYVQNLETRFPRRLLPKGARTALTLTAKDPTNVSGSSKLGEFKLGSSTNKIGGPISVSDNVTAIDEQEGRMYFHRGQLSAQVLLSSWAVEASAIQPEPVAGAVNYYGKGRIGLGAPAPMRSRVSASSTGAVYESTQTLDGENVYAGPLAVGSDRCWYITRGSSGELENLAGYTLDGFQTIANPFAVGDAKTKANGIGPFGPFTFFGNYSNIYSFTDLGKPVPLSQALVGFRSPNNGSQFADPGWGWLYAITDIGLRALTSHIDNPVGIGEGMRQFNGHAGKPTAIWAGRGELFVIYQTVAGDSYAYRCTFGPETAQTGQPNFYPWWYKASTTCKVIFSTNTPTNPAVVWGEGTNAAYETISRDGRDDLLAARTYDTNGGTWWGTELDRDPHLLKVQRLSRLHAKNLTSGSTWTLAMSFDRGSYVDVGEVTESGFFTLYPVQDQVSAPLTAISGRAMKPRLTLVAAGSGASTTPPELAGVLEVAYDERPEYITEIASSLRLDGTPVSKSGVIDALEELMSNSQDGPLRCRFSDEKSDFYAMVQKATNRRDIKGDGVEAIDCILHKWDVA